MSTAEVARDMELMRRAVGDKKLTYLGFSYGTYLGQVYANMFPTRFRAVAVDGVLDPVAWAGDKSNVDQPLELRLNSSGGAAKVLREILVRCDRVGGAKCRFAAGDPVANTQLIGERLRAAPVVIEDEEFGESFTFTYQDLVGSMLSALYDPAGYQYIVDMLADLYVLTEPPSPSARSTGSRDADAARRLAALHRTAPTRSRAAARAGASPTTTASTRSPRSPAPTRERPPRAASSPAYAAQADERANYFGRLWLWGTSVCAGDAFTGDDEDAYTGPFDTKTTSAGAGRG